MQKQIVLLLLVTTSALPLNAIVPPLEAALNAGKVCEKVDGFIQPTPGNEAEESALVESINAERASVYAEIAKNQGTDPATVGALCAKDLRAKNPNRACR